MSSVLSISENQGCGFAAFSCQNYCSVQKTLEGIINTSQSGHFKLIFLHLQKLLL